MLHVPSDGARLKVGLMGTPPGVPYGSFLVASCEPGWQLALICDNGEETGWEHVSVRALRGPQSRIPTWREMCFIKDLCWEPEDTVVQYHPAQSTYVNRHPSVLHLWRLCNGTLPMPPIELV